MRIGPTGEISWAQATIGQFAITVRVTDGIAFTEQPYVLTVGNGNALDVQAVLMPGIANAGQTVTLTVAAGSGLTKTARLDCQPLPLNARAWPSSPRQPRARTRWSSPRPTAAAR